MFSCLIAKTSIPQFIVFGKSNLTQEIKKLEWQKKNKVVIDRTKFVFGIQRSIQNLNEYQTIHKEN